VSTFWVALRFVFSYAFASLAFTGIIWLFLGSEAFIVCPIALLVALLFLSFSLQTRMIAFCRAGETPSPGLSHSYRRALEDSGLSLTPPELRVIPSPTLQLLVARSVGGSGLVLLSQGLLGLLSENELRAVLSRAARRASRGDTPIRSLASWIALKLLGWAPPQWLSVSFEVAPDRAAPGSLTPPSLFRFLVVLPLIRFFHAMSLLDSIDGLVLHPSGGEAPSEDLNSALHKVHRAIQTWRLTSTPVRYPFL
jgi:hypothetical protein